MANRLTRMLAKRWRILTDPEFRAFRARIKRFKREQGDDTPSRFETLTAESVVLDFGGYEGEWTATMRRLYDCHVHVFEPHPVFGARLAERFSKDAKVTLHVCALGQKAGQIDLQDSEDASSAFETDGRTVSGRVEVAAEILEPLAVRFAAAKLNIEGGEYDLLPALIDSGMIARIDVLVIQFHQYAPDDRSKRAALRKALEKTHVCDWCYDFVWEQWSRRI